MPCRTVADLRDDAFSVTSCEDQSPTALMVDVSGALSLPLYYWLHLTSLALHPLQFSAIVV